MSSRFKRKYFLQDLIILKCISITDSRFWWAIWFWWRSSKAISWLSFERSYRRIVKEWYDGYHFGNVDVYCPWMWSSCGPFMQNWMWATVLLDQFQWKWSCKKILLMLTKTTRDELERIDWREKYEKQISRMELTYDEIDNSIDNLWSIYLWLDIWHKKVKSEGVYRLVILNKEETVWGICSSDPGVV